MAFLSKHCRPAFLVLLLAASLMAPAAAKAESAQPMQLYDQKIKAGLIYNFLKFTTWPSANPGVSQHLKVCLIGGDPFDGYLNPLRGRTAQQKVIEIKPVKSMSEMDDCNLLFISTAVRENLPDIIEAVKGRPILTVSDIDEFTRQGGIIELSVKDDQRIHLYINSANLAHSGLTVSGRILSLAEVVQ